MTTDLIHRLARLEERVTEIESAIAQGQLPGFGLTIDEARAKLGQPVERGPQQVERLQRVLGSFSGPADLSSNMRDYLYGKRD